MKKGILALGGLSLLLALPVAANGMSAITRGGDDYEISFGLRTFNGEPVEIRNFKFKRLDAFCDGGAVVQVRGRIRSMAVNDRNKFRGVLRRGAKRVRVKGKVSGDLKKVRGKIRARGDFAPALNCDSGVVRWRARG